MPNVRKKGKYKMGVWLDPKERATLHAISEKLGMSITDFIRLQTLEAAERLGIKDHESKQTTDNIG